MEILFLSFVGICVIAVIFVLSKFLSSGKEESLTGDVQPPPVTPSSEVTDLLIQNKILLEKNQDFFQENQNFRKQLDGEKGKNEQTTVQILELNKEIARLKEENKKLAQKNDDYEEEKRKPQVKELDLSLSEDLKKENMMLKEDHDKLNQDTERLKDLNRQLLEKEKIIHYDLIRSRAQAVGLEKICEDLKIKIEQISKTAEVNNEEKT